MAITVGRWGALEAGPLCSGKFCPDCDYEILWPLPHFDVYRCPNCLRFFPRYELENRGWEHPLKVEIASSTGEDLGKVFGNNVIKKAQETYIENRAYYKDAPPETGGASAISLKKSIEAAVIQMEGMLSTILIEGEDESCHASARIQFKIVRVDIEVWETRGKASVKK